MPSRLAIWESVSPELAQISALAGKSSSSYFKLVAALPLTGFGFGNPAGFSSAYCLFRSSQ